ncbi:hypothetical protein ACFV2D_27265 [Streptomyces capillispiralis]|uniref:hypothetical protein n=1 Tax=Streptomyces capillispiralis TaxID=68182 RepID=UPI0036AC39AC
MGVFARIFRRSKAAEETGTVEAGGATADSGTEDAADAAEPKGSAEAPEDAGTAVREAGDKVTGAGSVEIPKQQSSEAAGNEAGEGART